MTASKSSVKWNSAHNFCPERLIELALLMLCLHCPSVQLENPSDPHNVLDEAVVAALETIHHIPPPEAHMSTPELIRHNNYPVEEHFVVTEDGYNLTMFRIPRGKQGKPGGGEPVIIQHALLCSSDDWLLILPNSEDNLRYDVWITNSRGNNYSMKHLTLSPDSLAFWNFSFHEMGIYDTPSFIYYILETTGKSQLSYVGHSMGCSMFFIAMIRHPYLQSKVRKMVALAPATYFMGTNSPAAIVLALVPSPILQMLLDTFKQGRVLASGVNKWLNDNGPSLCSGTIPADMCMNLIFFIVGYDFKQTTNYSASMILGHTPSETSAKTLVHFVQLVKQDSFQEFDYGFLGNLQRYGTLFPPKYNLTENNVATFVMWGLNDWLVKPTSAARNIHELGNVTRSEAVKDKWFNHLDFMYAKNAKEMVYDHCLEYLAD
ncbi:unnamed protein product [Allacma fusca]|uniref:Lipase n=1 Tax=Allacma fusca TaxID=39272 RepID=A0A8J2KYK4_9HEXA|nr:unnamed protein product [Allacma fusca]